MEETKDWCISRQLWWGHRIPAYYFGKNEFVVAANKEQALEKAKLIDPDCKLEDLRQDEDVLDTWFSSWLWPISCFNGINEPNNPEINYYYPTSDLITGPDIIFFWVARMIMAGLEFRGEIPFHNVYFTGIVRDKLGRKMSKTLGNSPDPILLIDQYGADGVRMGMLMSSPAGNDLPFDEAYCEQGRNFSNKIWNALRLVKGWETNQIEQPLENVLAIDWFQQRMDIMLRSIEDDFSKYRLSECLKNIYTFIWDDFCSWYLEIIKPKYGEPIDKTTYDKTIEFFSSLMKILQPFMPFVTQEIYSNLDAKDSNESFLMDLSYPKPCSDKEDIDQEVSFVKEIIVAIRGLRNSKGISPKQVLKCFVRSSQSKATILKYQTMICKAANTEKLVFVEDKQADTLSLMVRTTELYIPITQNINKDEEASKVKEQIKYYQGFMASIEKKLSNEKFVNNAPQKVVDLEKKKLEDCKTKLEALDKELSSLLG